jgi:hypothetical protein
LYSPLFHAGSFLIESMTIRRIIRLRPEIWTGRLAKGISASMKPGYFSPHTQVCIPPIEVPITSRR